MTMRRHTTTGPAAASAPRPGTERTADVLVTGIGVTAPNGLGTHTWWQALLHGRSGIKALTRFDATRYPVRLAGEIRAIFVFETCDRRRHGSSIFEASETSGGAGVSRLDGLDRGGTRWAKEHARSHAEVARSAARGTDELAEEVGARCLRLQCGQESEQRGGLRDGRVEMRSPTDVVRQPDGRGDEPCLDAHANRTCSLVPDRRNPDVMVPLTRAQPLHDRPDHPLQAAPQADRHQRVGAHARRVITPEVGGFVERRDRIDGDRGWPRFLSKERLL